MTSLGSGYLISRTAFGITVTLAIALTIINTDLPTEAQSCQPLKAIGGSATKVRKTVSPPGTNTASNNWNTDFVVPSNQKYERYVVTFMAETSGAYEVEMYLKYSDETSDRFYNAKSLQLDKGESITISAQPRSDAIPNRVNVKIGGVTAVGRNYTMSVTGCNQ